MGMVKIHFGKLYFTKGGGDEGKLTLKSLHMVSYYLSKHSKGLKAITTEIKPQKKTFCDCMTTPGEVWVGDPPCKVKIGFLGPTQQSLGIFHNRNPWNIDSSD